MAEHLTIPGALEWDAVERHSIATLRYAGGKEHFANCSAPFLFENDRLNHVSTSLTSIRKELRTMEADGLVDADRRMRNVTVWTLKV